jgi:hypothetical protein
MTEKYGFDLRHAGTWRIEEKTWDAGSVLEPTTGGVWQPQPMLRNNEKFPISSPKYAGSVSSPGGSRIAVDSWSGTVRDPPQILSWEPGPSSLGFLIGLIRAHYDGHYWIDIHDVVSGSRVVQIRGDFHGDHPLYFQGKAKWLNGRYYVLPLEPEGMRRLLVCDIDAAAKSKGLTEFDAPVPLARAKPFLQHSRSSYQMRFLEPEVPQAHITGFHDEAVSNAASGQIERVNVTASVDVQVAGEYSLELNVSGIQERAVGVLTAGNAQLTVPFAVRTLRELGSSGPFKIHQARLIRMVDDGQIVAENSFDRETAPSPNVTFIDAITQAYSISQLGSSVYFTGENSAKLIPAVGSEPEHLEVRIGVYSKEAGCQGYGLLARAQTTPDSVVTDSPGRRALILNFTGKGTSEPGPYHIEQLGIRCGNDFIRSQSLEVSAR